MKAVKYCFDARELTCSIFEYTLDEFKNLEPAEEVRKWEKDLDEKSSSYPVFVDSPFGKSGLDLPTSIDEEPDGNKLYAIPHYFYSSASYSIEEPIDKSCEIKLAPIVGHLMKEGPMDWAEKNGEQIYFEGIKANNGSKFTVNFYFQKKLVGTSLLSDFDSSTLENISKACI
jgi:hypothetical protein